MIRLNVHKNKRLPDIALIAVVTVLVSAGMVFIYSASMYSAEKTYGDAFYLVKKQAVGVYGKEFEIPVPYCEYTYHMIKALEEKNDGRFAYTGEEEPTWSK